MEDTNQIIECYRKTDRRGHYYYTEVWTDTTYLGNGQFKHKVVASGRCKKQDFEDRMERTVFIEKSENHIMFNN
jgi:hypothetical protein